MKLPKLINKKVLSIDFGSNQIKIIEGQATEKGITILNSITVDLSKDAYRNGEILDGDNISILLKNALNKNKISTITSYGIINSSSIIIREVIIPEVPEKEVAAIIGFQLEDFFPIDPEGFVINHLILGTVIEDDISKLNIQIIGIPKTMVLEHLNLLEKAGLKPEILDYQGNSMAKLLNFNDRINEDYSTRDIVFASIDMGYDSTKLTIIKNGKMEVTKVLDIGAKILYENLSSFSDCSMKQIEPMVEKIENINDGQKDFTDYNRILNITKSTMENLLEKVEKIIRYYRTRSLKNDVNLILLQGGLSNIKGIDNLYSNYFNIPTVILTSLDKIKWDGDLSKYSNTIGGLIRID